MTSSYNGACSASNVSGRLPLHAARSKLITRICQQRSTNGQQHRRGNAAAAACLFDLTWSHALKMRECFCNYYIKSNFLLASITYAAGINRVFRMPHSPAQHPDLSECCRRWWENACPFTVVCPFTAVHECTFTAICTFTVVRTLTAICTLTAALNSFQSRFSWVKTLTWFN